MRFVQLTFGTVIVSAGIVLVARAPAVREYLRPSEDGRRPLISAFTPGFLLESEFFLWYLRFCGLCAILIGLVAFYGTIR